MRKKVACRWRLFNSGTATSRCTVLASSKVSETAAVWSFHGSTRSVGVWAALSSTNKLHTNTANTSFAINSQWEFHDGLVQLQCQQLWLPASSSGGGPALSLPRRATHTKKEPYVLEGSLEDAEPHQIISVG